MNRRTRSKVTAVPQAAGLSRRSFTALAAGVPGCCATQGFGAPPAEGPSEKLNVAMVGVGGQGGSNLGGVQSQNVVALCDVDERRAAKAFEQLPNVRRFADFRKMFDAMEKEIDAVVVSTPDHTHFHPAWWAMERGKHVYLEKPLAHKVEEVRQLTEAALPAGFPGPGPVGEVIVKAYPGHRLAREVRRSRAAPELGNGCGRAIDRAIPCGRGFFGRSHASVGGGSADSAPRVITKPRSSIIR